MSLKYHFSFCLYFKKDANVEELEKLFGIKAYKLTKLSEAKSTNKRASIWYRTEDFTSVMIGECFDNFVEKIKDNFVELPQVLQQFEGECEFSVVVDEMDEKPSISINENTIKTLAYFGASYDVDFLC